MSTTTTAAQVAPASDPLLALYHEWRRRQAAFILAANAPAAADAESNRLCFEAEALIEPILTIRARTLAGLAAQARVVAVLVARGGRPTDDIEQDGARIVADTLAELAGAELGADLKAGDVAKQAPATTIPLPAEVERVNRKMEIVHEICSAGGAAELIAEACADKGLDGGVALLWLIRKISELNENMRDEFETDDRRAQEAA